MGGGEVPIKDGFPTPLSVEGQGAAFWVIAAYSAVYMPI